VSEYPPPPDIAAAECMTVRLGTADWFARVGVLHAALLGGDEAGVEELAALLYQRGTTYLNDRRRYRDPQENADAVVDAIVAYLDRPARAHARDGRQVWAHIQLAAWRNAFDNDKSDRRRAVRESIVGQEEGRRHQSSAQRVIELCLCTSEARGPDGLDAAVAESVLEAQVAKFDDPVDRECARLMLLGEHRCEVYARVLGIADLPIKEQRALVKKAKDRIKYHIEPRSRRRKADR
jgi:hypothetical protein